MCTAVMGTFCGIVAKAGAAGRRALHSEEEKKENWGKKSQRNRTLSDDDDANESSVDKMISFHTF